MEITLQAEKIYLANKYVDFRKSINGLCALVVEEMQKEPGKGIYIFYNKNLDRIKVLGWHRNGFALIIRDWSLESFLCVVMGIIYKLIQSN